MAENTDKLSSIVDRFLAPTPDFWKKVRAIALVVGGIGTSILLVPTTVVVLPVIVKTIAGYMVAVGLVAAGSAQTTIK